MAASQSAVPTLDYALWAGPDASQASREQFATELRNVAVAGHGFFVLINSPLDAGKRRASLFELATSFFALRVEERRKVSMDNSRHFRGYAAFGDERTLGKQDLRDQLELGEDRAAFPKDNLTLGQLKKQPYLNLLGPNQFPDDDVLPGLKQAATEWFDLGREINLELTLALERALGLEPDTLVRILADAPADREERGKAEEAFANACASASSPIDKSLLRYEGPAPYFRMKIIRYPRADVVDGIAKADQDSTQGVGAHKDGGWLTLLATDQVGGLQVQDFAGQWIDVPVSSDGRGIIVNAGQQIEKLTRGAIQAATHRVILPPQARDLPDRYSIAWFSTPSLTAHVDALPWDAFPRELIDVWTNSGRPDAPTPTTTESTTQKSSSANGNAANGHGGVRIQDDAAQASGGAPTAPAGETSTNPDPSQGAATSTSTTTTTTTATLISDVPHRDLHGSQGEEFGLLAWRGITRSHPSVVRAWHMNLVPPGSLLSASAAAAYRGKRC